MIEEFKTSNISSFSDVTRMSYDLYNKLIKEGFTKKAATEAAIIASELGTNLVKYASPFIIHGKHIHGNIHIKFMKDKKSLDIMAEDKGPGIINKEQVLIDGYSRNGIDSIHRLSGTRFSFGTGLPAIKRLAKSFDILNNEYGGTTIKCQYSDNFFSNYMI